MTAFNALVLAGTRGGPDPFAESVGVPHKALILLQGRTLLERVVTALREAGAARICVSANHPAVVEAASSLGVEVLDAAQGPSLSVEQGAAAMGTPLLITTSDHALLAPEWIHAFLAGIPQGTDVAAMLANRAVIERDAGGTKRTYLPFTDGGWSGCNLFYLGTPQALKAVDFWKRLEAERKRPWKMAAILGPGALAAFLLRRLTLQGAVEKLGRLAGVRAAAVPSPFGLAAVDVDKPADLDFVRKVVGEA